MRVADLYMTPSLTRFDTVDRFCSAHQPKTWKQHQEILGELLTVEVSVFQPEPSLEIEKQLHHLTPMSG